MDMETSPNTLSAEARAVAERVRNLRDYLDLLAEHGQCITWPEAVMPEPDIRKVVVAAGRDAMAGPGHPVR